MQDFVWWGPRGINKFYRGEKGILEKLKQDPEKKGLEKKQGGKNKDIRPEWVSPRHRCVSPRHTWVSPRHTWVSPRHTWVSPRHTWVSPRHTCVPPDRPPGAKSQKTRGKWLIFHEIDVFRSIFNFDKSIRLRISFWKQKKYQKYHSYRFFHPN